MAPVSSDPHPGRRPAASTAQAQVPIRPRDFSGQLGLVPLGDRRPATRVSKPRSVESDRVVVASGQRVASSSARPTVATTSAISPRSRAPARTVVAHRLRGRGRCLGRGQPRKSLFSSPSQPPARKTVLFLKSTRASANVFPGREGRVAATRCPARDRAGLRARRSVWIPRFGRTAKIRPAHADSLARAQSDARPLELTAHLGSVVDTPRGPTRPDAHAAWRERVDGLRSVGWRRGSAARAACVVFAGTQLDLIGGGLRSGGQR